MLSTLIDGFHFSSPETFNQIEFVDSINGQEASWSLGFMTNKTNEIESRPGKRGISLTGMVIMVVLGSLLVLLGALAIAVFHRKHNNRLLHRTN